MAAGNQVSEKMSERRKATSVKGMGQCNAKQLAVIPFSFFF